MGTTNRQFRPQVKMKYVNPSSLKTSKKEQAVLNNNLSSIDKRNDVLDSLLYSSYTTTTTSTTGMFDGPTWATGSSTSSSADYYGRKREAEVPLGEQIQLLRNEKDSLRAQSDEHLEAIRIFTKVIESIHVLIQELDYSDLRTSEPFKYRLERNELDDTLNYTLRLMSTYGTPRLPMGIVKLKDYFKSKGLL